MTDTTPAPGLVEPHPLARAIALDLVTRYRLRLVAERDGRLGALSGRYELGTAAWTGKRAAFVGFFVPPANPEAALADVEERCRVAHDWGADRLAAQPAERCDILLIALGSVPQPAMPPPPGGMVSVSVAAVDPRTAQARTVWGSARGVPSAGELRAQARALLNGRPAPSLAAVDLAERQTVSEGLARPVQRAVITAPVATYTFIAVFVAVWLVEKVVISVSGPNGEGVGLVRMGALVAAPPWNGDWWRYVSNTLLHDDSNILHLLFNCFGMFVIGRLVEQLYGRLVLVATFLVTAVAGGLVWVGVHVIGLESATNGAISIGASGGIFGLMGLLILFGRYQGRDVAPGAAAALRQSIAIWAVFGIMSGFLLANVDNEAHIGGFIAGALLGVVIPPLQRVGGRNMKQGERVALGAVVAAGVVALVVAAINTASTFTGAPLT